LTDLIRAWFLILMVVVVLGTYVTFVEAQGKKSSVQPIAPDSTTEETQREPPATVETGEIVTPESVAPSAVDDAQQTTSEGQPPSDTTPVDSGGEAEDPDGKSYDVEPEEWGGEPSPSPTREAEPKPVPDTKSEPSSVETKVDITLCSLLGTDRVARKSPETGQGLIVESNGPTPIYAVAAGRVVRINRTADGRTSVYLVAKDGSLTFTYAGLLQTRAGLSQNAELDCGAQIGQIDPSSPLRFAVAELKEGVKWWQGTSIDPSPYLGPEPEVVEP